MFLGSGHFKKIFLVRFLGYFLMQIGLVTVTLMVEPVVGQEVKYRFDQLTGRTYSLPAVVTSSGTDLYSGSGTGEDRDTVPAASLGSALGRGTETIVPVSTDFGIVIEKINASARVVANVDPSDEAAYIQALGRGVAHAQGTAFPGQKGNIYLFSHSTDAPWNIVRYNAIFYLLGKLDPGDRVIMFYQGRRYDYIVFDKQIVKPEDTHFLTDTYDQSVLTLQTCDPPGTLVNRLIIRAKLVGS